MPGQYAVNNNYLAPFYIYARCFWPNEMFSGLNFDGFVNKIISSFKKIFLVSIYCSEEK
jgi:hypothetical protein